MNWGTFFNSRPIKSGAIAGGIGLTVGISASAMIALKVASQCSEMANALLVKLSENITLPDITATINLRGHSTPVELTDISMKVPDDINHFNEHLHDLPSSCFSGAFFIGVCLILAISLALASCVAVGVDLYDRQKAAEETNQYSLITMDSSVH